MGKISIDWNTSYERTMNHTYMVLSKCHFFGAEQEEKEDYRVRMLLENRIPGILPVTQRRQDGENRFYYEINSLQPMSQMYEQEEINAEALETLLYGCIRVFDKLEEYLLDGAQILLKPEYIYIHPDTKEPYFTYYPKSDIDVRESFVLFVDYLLERLNHTQEEAIMLGYQVYRYTRNPNFVLSGIMEILSEHAQKKIEKRVERKEPHIEEPDIVDTTEYDNEEEIMWECVPNDIEEEESYRKQSNQKESGIKKRENHRKLDRNQLVKELLQVGKKEFYGVLISLGLTAVSCFALFFVKVLNLITIPYIYEMYLCGILAMALVAAGMFAYSLYKKREEWKEIRLLSKDVLV